MISGLATAVSILTPAIGLVALPSNAPVAARILMIVVPLLIVAGALPFMIRGYRIELGCLPIRRLGWFTRLDLDDLQSAEVNREAMKNSLRLMGNGGLFVFAGWFWNRKLGRYRALVTDPSRSVVLRFRERTVVVSPDAPEEFVDTLKRVTRHG